MSFKFKKSVAVVLGLSLALSIPSMAFAASDTGWVKSSKLYEIRTWVGQAELGHQNGSLSTTTFYHPHAAVALPDGRLLVSDSSNHLLRVISESKSDTYAGLDLGEDITNQPIGGYNDDSLARSAFDRPTGLAIDAQGNVYVADTDNNAIRRVSKDGQVTTLAGNGLLGLQDGRGAAATFYAPSDVAVDANGNVYVADTLNHIIRKITADGTVSTLTAESTRIIEQFPGDVEYVGDFQDGPIASAKFNEPSGLAIDAKGNLYVSDRGNQRIRYIDLSAGTVTTVAGGGAIGVQAAYVEGDYVDGAAAQSRLSAPEGLIVTPDGAVVVADSLNHVIRIIKAGQVTTLAGIGIEYGQADGVTASAQFNHPTDVTMLVDGRLVIVDEFNNRVRVLQKYAKPASLPTDESIAVLLNGAIIPSDVPAQLKKGAVSLPIRSVGAALGYDVKFNQVTGEALLTKGDTVYTITNNSSIVTKTVKGVAETLTLNAPTRTVSNRIFIPVRFFAEESGLDIQWDAEDNNVVIRNSVF